MLRSIVATVGLVVVLWPSLAQAAPCGGFTDVDDANPATAPFCANVAWLKNRQITLGCSSPSFYCPNDAVSRLAMAAFMSRLATVLTPTVAFANVLGGAESLNNGTYLCATVVIPAKTYDRTLHIHGALDLYMTNATNVFVAPVYSFDNGVTWMYTNLANLLVATNSFGAANAPIASVDVVIPAGQPTRAAVYIYRAPFATANIIESQCVLRAVTSNALPV